jgi:hypothetical protein
MSRPPMYIYGSNQIPTKYFLYRITSWFRMVKGEALLFLAGHFFSRNSKNLTRFSLSQNKFGSNVLITPSVSTGGFLHLIYWNHQSPEDLSNKPGRFSFVLFKASSCRQSSIFLGWPLSKISGTFHPRKSAGRV